MSSSFGRVENCSWYCFCGPLTENDWNQYIDFVVKLDVADVLLTAAFESTPPSPAQRKIFTETIKKRLVSTGSIVASAFITDSLLVQGALTAINWIAKKPFPEKVFTKPRAAVEWLARMSPYLDVNGVLISMHAAIPAQFRRYLGF